MKLLGALVFLVIASFIYLSWVGISNTNKNRARASALNECMQINGTPKTHNIGRVERSQDNSWLRVEVDGVSHTFYSSHKNFSAWQRVVPNSQITFEYSEDCLDNQHPDAREAYEFPSGN